MFARLFNEVNSKPLLLLLVCISLMLSGCQTARDRQGVSSNLVSYLYPDGKRPDHAADQIPHLKLPLRVGIAFIPETSSDFSFTLTEVEKYDLLNKVAKQFETRPFVESIDIIPDIYLRQGKGFETVSQIAALHNIDIIALVSYDQVSMTEENQLSLTYLTIVGAFIFPGETTQSHTFIDTAVFDVKTQKLLFRAPGADTDSRTHNVLANNRKTRALRLKTFTTAADKMVVNLEQELDRFRVRAKRQQTVQVSYRKGYSGGGSSGLTGLLLLLLLVRFSRIKR